MAASDRSQQTLHRRLAQTELAYFPSLVATHNDGKCRGFEGASKKRQQLNTRLQNTRRRGANGAVNRLTRALDPFVPRQLATTKSAAVYTPYAKFTAARQTRRTRQTSRPSLHKFGPVGNASLLPRSHFGARGAVKKKSRKRHGLSRTSAPSPAVGLYVWSLANRRMTRRKLWNASNQLLQSTRFTFNSFARQEVTS